jgi:protein Tex
MNNEHVIQISKELDVKAEQVLATAKLLSEEATVPFIARYRKEVTGSLDEVAIMHIRDRLAALEELDKRRESILKSLQERELLTEELKEKIQKAGTMSILEDIYLPYRPKRRTRATVAKEKGLEPLAGLIFKQDGGIDPAAEASAFIDPEKGVSSTEEALAGARDIIAEWVNEHQEARGKMRSLYAEKGVFVTKVISGKEAEGAKYRDYFTWEERVTKAPSHRILACRRGEKEGILDLRVSPPEEEALSLLESIFVKGEGPASQMVKEAVHDSYHRLLDSSMETEIRIDTKERADKEAIKVFAENLRELILAPPLGQKKVIAIDPGIRTGCKLACLDPQGKLLHTDTIYPFDSEKRRQEASEKFFALYQEYEPEAIAVGNGTAGRETESFIRGLALPGNIPAVMVNESGASVYSASEVARGEFPDLDVSLRGAVSIGRRLMDPLAELVKIDPKSIGVGQYQHDVNQQSLKRSLDDVVISCVNGVGVEVNTASEQLLGYVSGLGQQLAKKIVAFRNENGPFVSREALKRVPRLGPKAYEQAAGFLRIREGENPLDASAVHPESYSIVEAMARDVGCTVKDLLSDQTLRQKIAVKRYVTENVGLPTLLDILAELAKPGRDPRRHFETSGFTEGIMKVGDLKPGMRLPGIVTNVTAFGAFVDIGVHQDGLVHISEMAERFVKDAREVVRVQHRVMVRVLGVDLERGRISLSLKEGEGHADKGPAIKAKEAPKREKAEKKLGPAPFNNPFSKAFRG